MKYIGKLVKTGTVALLLATPHLSQAASAYTVTAIADEGVLLHSGSDNVDAKTNNEFFKSINVPVQSDPGTPDGGDQSGKPSSSFKVVRLPGDRYFNLNADYGSFSYVALSFSSTKAVDLTRPVVEEMPSGLSDKMHSAIPALSFGTLNCEAGDPCTFTHEGGDNFRFKVVSNSTHEELGGIYFDNGAQHKVTVKVVEGKLGGVVDPLLIQACKLAARNEVCGNIGLSVSGAGLGIPQALVSLELVKAPGIFSKDFVGQYEARYNGSKLLKLLKAVGGDFKNINISNDWVRITAESNGTIRVRYEIPTQLSL
ncbi:MAG: hypothetical protein EOP06_03470 [Proteobacteria bacterium]|nr:MAG: hypothetical protein EOP06_03470 [Pseudomonadota bacterium]